MEQQRGLSEDWRRRAVEALDDRWDEMRRPGWNERARILEEERLLEERLRREEEEYEEMEKQRRLEERRRREEERRRRDEHLRWKLKQLELKERRQLEAEHQRTASELRRKEEEQQRKDEELRRKDEELKRKEEELCRWKEEQPKINQELEGQHMRQVDELRTAQLLADMDKSLKHSGSSHGPPGDRERPPSCRSRVQPSLTDQFVRSSSSAVGVTLHLNKSPGQPEGPSFTNSEEIQEQPRSSNSSRSPTSELLVRHSGRHTSHIPSEVLHSESPTDPTGTTSRVGRTGGGRKYRTQAPAWNHVDSETQNEESGCRCSIM